MREYQPDAVLRLVGVRTLGHGDVVGGERFFRAAGLEQRLAEIQMRVPRRRIVADDVAEEGRFVAVDARLPPRQRSQQHQDARGDAHGDPPARPERPNHCRQRARRGGEAEGGRRSAERGRATDEDGQRPDVGQILIAVRDERELHVAVFHQPEHRRQRGREEQDAGERPAADPPAQPPERRGRGDGCDDVPPRERVRGVHLPVRVDDDEGRRPEQLADIDPQRVRRDEHALDEGVIDVDDFLVIGHVRDGDAQPHREERHRAEQVGSGHAPLFPPTVDQQRRRQSDADGFAEQPRGEQHERQDVAPRPVLRVRPFDEAEPRQRRAHVEQDGEQVLAPDHPGGGFDVDRMHGEYRRGDPRPGYRQPRQQPPHQGRIGPVQQQVDGVEAQRGEAPQPMFQPEGRISERPVVALALNLARREPDAPQAGRFPHRRGLGERPVVPDEAAQQRGKVADAHQQAERQYGQRHPAGERGRGAGARGAGRSIRRRGSLLRGRLRAARGSRSLPRGSSRAAASTLASSHLAHTTRHVGDRRSRPTPLRVSDSRLRQYAIQSRRAGRGSAGAANET